MEREFFSEFYFGNINGEEIRAGKKLQLNDPQFGDFNFTSSKQNTTKDDATPREENPMAMNFSFLPRSTNSIGAPFNDANLGSDIGESSTSMDSLGFQEKERVFFEKEQSKTNKRKGREATEMESPKGGEDGEKGAEARKPNQRATSSRRSRTAEMHNLSERRRRDRINEKLKALQELLPHCNKTDKASMLDEAIEYLKSLQIQLQMMWIESGMAPMIFPETHHCMSMMAMDHHHDHHHDANSLQHTRITRPLFDDRLKLKDLNANQPVNPTAQTENLYLHKFSTQETNQIGFGARMVQEQNFGNGLGIDRSSFL